MSRTSPKVWSLLLAGTAACGDPASILGDACEPEVSVVVSAGLSPMLTWSPDCAVGTLLVTTEPGDGIWQISSEPEADLTPTNRIRSGVTYGSVPELAQQWEAGAERLVADQTYRVFLHVTDSQGHSTLVGQGLFTASTE